MFAERREHLLQDLHREGVGALLVTDPINVGYLTGFSGDSSCLVVGAGRTLLISDGRFTTQIVDECPGLEALIRPAVQPLGEAAAAAIKKLGVSVLGFESGHLTVADFEGMRALTGGLEWRAGADRVERLRLIKDADEIAQIRQSISCAEKAFAVFRSRLLPQDTEKELADRLEYLVRQAGARCTAFPSIVAAGPRAALPHAPPTDKVVGDAPLLLVDWGASAPFYKSDLTRVLLTHNNSASSGTGMGRRGVELDPKISEVYETVARAQRQAIAAVRPGVAAKDVDAAARQVIADAGFGEYFTHSIGHGIGMKIHEAPIMRANTQEVLRAGMVITIEPGIYLPGFVGVRIEDDVLVTPDGCEVLTNVPKSLDSAIHQF